MTPAEQMREQCAVLVARCEWYAGDDARALTGDALRRVAEAMPRVAGEWEHRERWGSRVFIHRATESADAADWAYYENVYQALDAYASGWTQEAPCEACTYVGPATVQTWHETPRAAQAACDARLEAAGVRLCGEIVKEGGT